MSVYCKTCTVWQKNCSICDDNPLSSDAVLADVRAIVMGKYIKAISLNQTATGNEKRLAVIIECELIDDLPDTMIGKTVKISEHFA